MSGKTGIGEMRRFMLILTALYWLVVGRPGPLLSSGSTQTVKTSLPPDSIHWPGPHRARQPTKSNKESYMISLQPGVSNGLRRVPLLPQRFFAGRACARWIWPLGGWIASLATPQVPLIVTAQEKCCICKPSSLPVQRVSKMIIT